MNMEDQKKIIDNLTKVVLRHERLIEALAKSTSDITKLMSKMLSRCAKFGCDKPATMKHKLHNDKTWCDRCAAEVIVNAKKMIKADHFNIEADSRCAFNQHIIDNADETLWEDVTDADEIRRVMVYVELMKSLQDTH